MDWGLGHYERTAVQLLALAARTILEPRGETEAVRDKMLAVLESANEDPNAFRVTSRYIVAVLRRH
ncbi:MAG: hypothetical protein WBM00_03490 [Solirubrobacterales bacterium]